MPEMRRPVREPSAWSSAWQCDQHGEVHPLRVMDSPSSEGLQAPLWHVEAPCRAAFAGEVNGSWLWLVLWPDSAGVLLVEPMPLRDLRDPGQDLDLPFGARSPRLGG